MAYPRIKLADNSGNEVAVTSNALDVNIAGGASIDIGDVDMFLDGGTALLGGAGAVASGVLRVTLASDDPAVAKLGTIDTDTGDMVGLLTTMDVDTGNITLMAHAHDATVGGIGQKGIEIHCEAKENDGTAMPNNVAEGDYIRPAASLSGVQYVALTNDTGRYIMYGQDDAVAPADPGILFVGGEYRSSDTTYSNGDATVLQTNVNGALKVIDISAHVDDTSFTLGTDSGIMMMGFAGTQSISTNAVGAFRCTTTGALHIYKLPSNDMQSYSNEDVSSSTAEEIKSSTICERVDMMADWANTGYIYVGGSDVSANNGIRLAPGDFYSIDIDNTNEIYVLASVDGEDIHFTVYTI